MSSARTPSSSRRRAARPNSSPSGPPQCWPKTPHTPWRQRRKLVHTGMPVATSASMAASVRPSRMSVIVSSRMRSGGWSSKVRGSSSMNSRRAGPSMSPLIENASATSSFLPACSIASRPTSTPRRAMSIQCSGARCAGALALHLGGEAPRVGGDDVAALLDVAAVHVAHHVGGVDQRPRAPQRLVARRARRRAAGARARWRCRRRGSRSARPSAAPRRGDRPAPRSRPAARPVPSCSTLMSAIVDPRRGASPPRG